MGTDRQGRGSINPADITTESGRPIGEAERSEILLLSDGSKRLGSIGADIAAKAGIPEGEIQANAGAVLHAQQQHGQEIQIAGYPNAVSLLMDVQNNYDEIRQGSGDSVLLAKRSKQGNSSVVAVELISGRGQYRAKTLFVMREKTLKKRKLLASGEPTSPAADPDFGLASFSADQSSRDNPRRWRARQTSNISDVSISPPEGGVNQSR